MLKAFKYRIYPSKEQAVLINKHIGCARFIFNLALETKQTAWAGNRVNLNCFDLINQIPDLKKECAWLKEINSQSLQQPIRNLDNAFTRFFKGQADFPKFKKKRDFGSFNIPQNIIIHASKLIIPKFKEGINITLHRPTKGVFKQATISKTSTGKFFVSVICDNAESKKEQLEVKENTTVGIDLGIKTFLVTSNGKEYDNPKFLKKSLGKLKYVQSKLSKYKGKRTKQKLAKLHENVANQRRDFLHKVSAELINSQDSFAIENLQISNMVKCRPLSQAISDSGWGMFIDMLEYKASWQGKNILKIGVFAPSSKTCSVCGSVNKELMLKEREWNCKQCNSILSRDFNAAINIKNFALKNYLSVERRLKNQNELPTLVGVLTSETHLIE